MREEGDTGGKVVKGRRIGFPGRFPCPDP